MKDRQHPPVAGRFFPIAGKLRHSALKAALAVFAIAVVAAGMVAHAVGARRASSSQSGLAGQSKSAKPQSMMMMSGDFAYWKSDGASSSELVMNNASANDLTVDPVLYNLAGVALNIPPVTLPPRQHATVNIGDWITAAGGDASFTEGNLLLNYMGADASDLGALMTITDSSNKTAFDVPDEMPMNYTTSQLEGAWWLPKAGSSYSMAVSNMTDEAVPITITPSGGPKRSVKQPSTITLNAHQTQVLSLEQIAGPLEGPASGPGTAGGITITHNAMPGSIIALGMTLNDKEGFSSHLPFSDPGMAMSSTYSATHLLLGKSDLAGLPAEASFDSTAVLRSTIANPVTVSMVFGFADATGAAQSVKLSDITLPPNQVLAMDLGKAVKKAGAKGPFANAGLTINYTGPDGALIAYVSSFESSGKFVFDVPCKDPLQPMNRGSGSYPWDISGDGQAVVNIRNNTGNPARGVIQIDFEGGSYSLPVKHLEPQQEASVDIRALRDGQVKDSIQRTIPLNVTTGLVRWFENSPQPLTGRLIAYSTSAGVSRSFSCGVPPGLCDVTPSFQCSPQPMTGDPGGELWCELLETIDNECAGEIDGPFDDSGGDTVWSIQGPGIATIGAYVDGLGVPVTLVTPGVTNVVMSYPYVKVVQGVTENLTGATSCMLTIKPHVGLAVQTPFNENQPVALGSQFTATLELQVNADPANGILLEGTEATVQLVSDNVEGSGQTPPHNNRGCRGPRLESRRRNTIRIHSQF